jgi:Dyp-type peroxidase family
MGLLPAERSTMHLTQGERGHEIHGRNERERDTLIGSQRKSDSATRGAPRGSSLAGTTNLALLAPVREGVLAAGFEPISHLERLRRLLDAMHASRRNARESELLGSPFPDPIGRFGIISSFRYALVPPGMVDSTRWHLSLNVSFDGGWEPYMRVIYRDIGALLDALLCHCVGYPGSSSTFDVYCRWVRSAELNAGIFYTDSGAPLGDRRYLASVERLQRESASPCQAALAVARHAERDDQTALNEGLARMLAGLPEYLPLQLRTLKGLYRLTSFWSGDDGQILRRFAKLVLKGFEATWKVLQAQALQQPEGQAAKVIGQLQAVFGDELAWLLPSLPPPPATQEPAWEPHQLQAALLDQSAKATHGAMVLLRVVDARAAARYLSMQAPACDVPVAAPPGGQLEVRRHVAFTYEGLRALGIHRTRLERLPAEFRDGMEARAGTLGDLRGNHPDHWRRPLRHGGRPGSEDRIDLDVVHVAVMLRLVDADDAGHGLHPELEKAVTALGERGTGMTVLAVEPTRSRTAGRDGREHFGFADGISQPVVDPAAPRFADLSIQPPGAPAARGGYADTVPPGELVLGFSNSRGDGPGPADALLDHGSFLVVRKLRQRLDHLQAALDAYEPRDTTRRDDLLAHMMGRRQDGTPLVGAAAASSSGPTNDYDFRGADGPQCPFASHARRANPRDGRPAMPRLLRRGMGYGPASDQGSPQDDRGTLFMAYCASIAEQFETIQGWLAGGNSSGVGSEQADPFLGVPKPGEARIFRWVDAQGTVQRVDLKDKPFVELQWGLYLFVPSLPVLRQLHALHSPAALRETCAPKSADPQAEMEAWRARVEDRDSGRCTWAAVREQGGRLDAAPYGQLVGSADAVFEALGDAQARHVSVKGFGERMDSTIGINHLGMDPADGHADIAPLVNAAIAKIGERSAFDAALAIATQVLADTIVASGGSIAMRHPDGRLRVPLDLMNFSDEVVGRLARQWFGLPDAKKEHMPIGGRTPVPDADEQVKPRCPGHLIGPSRMIFGAQPRDPVEAEGLTRGSKVRKAVREGVAAGVSGTVLDELRTTLQPLGQRYGPQLLADTLAGLLLGFAPTVHGNFLTVMRNWIEDKSLWPLQQDLAEAVRGGAVTHALARGVLRRRTLDTMQQEPVPPMVWRCPVVHDRPDTEAAPVVLGLASAIEDLGDAREDRRDALLFGGDYFAKPGSDRWGLHACPGAPMGLGVMMAMAAALLDAGTLRPTGSPVLLILTPKQPLPAPPARASATAA